MKCPKCGYKRQLRDNAYVPMTECPSCGIVYSKTYTNEAFAWSGVSPSTVAGVKSPVDETSLRQARERVESRLRKRLETRIQDERHQLTLARAKELTASRMRKRLAEKDTLPEEQTNPETPNGGKLARAVESPIGSSHRLRKPDQPVLEDENPALMEAGANDTLSEPLEDDTLMEALLDDTLNRNSAEDTLVEELAVNDTWPTFRTAEKAETSPNDNVAPTLPEPAVAAALGRSAHTVLGTGLMRLFNMVAWLILTAGIIGAVLSWTTLSDVEAGVRFSLPTMQGGLPLGLLLGFAYLATGVLGFAFFWVSSQISHQLKDIRRLLLVSPHASAHSLNE
jgi:hypothetical protein